MTNELQCGHVYPASGLCGLPERFHKQIKHAFVPPSAPPKAVVGEDETAADDRVLAQIHYDYTFERDRADAAEAHVAAIIDAVDRSSTRAEEAEAEVSRYKAEASELLDEIFSFAPDQVGAYKYLLAAAHHFEHALAEPAPVPVAGEDEAAADDRPMMPLEHAHRWGSELGRVRDELAATRTRAEEAEAKLETERIINQSARDALYGLLDASIIERQAKREAEAELREAHERLLAYGLVLGGMEEAEAEAARLRGHIQDIWAHATPYGDIPDEPGFVGTYLLTAGALHRAMGTVQYTVPSCEAEAKVSRLEAAIGIMFDQSGCDCDGTLYPGNPWEAPHHASDCPVYERWDDVDWRALAPVSGEPE